MKRLAVISMITLLALSMVFSTGVKEMVENGTLVLPGTEESVAVEEVKAPVEGMKELRLPPVDHLRDDYTPFSPSSPDDWRTFHWNDTPFIDIVKPDGN